MLHTVPVLQLFDLINPDQPVLWSEGFLQVFQIDVLVADLGIAGPVKAWRCPKVQLKREKQIDVIPIP